jgi:hypothetical protein
VMKWASGGCDVEEEEMYTVPPTGHVVLQDLAGRLAPGESSTSSSHVGASPGWTSVLRQRLRQPCRMGRLGGVGYVLQQGV